MPTEIAILVFAIIFGYAAALAYACVQAANEELTSRVHSRHGTGRESVVHLTASLVSMADGTGQDKHRRMVELIERIDLEWRAYTLILQMMPTKVFEGSPRPSAKFFDWA